MALTGAIPATSLTMTWFSSTPSITLARELRTISSSLLSVWHQQREQDFEQRGSRYRPRHNGGYGGWGLYTDAGASGVLVQNNLVYRTTDTSLHVNSWAATPPNPPPPPSIFRNNILAYGAMGAMDRHNDTTFLSIVFENNVFYYDKGSIQYGYWYCEGKTICTGYFQFDSNLYFNKNVVGGQTIRRSSRRIFPIKWRPAATGHPAHVPTMASARRRQNSLFANPQFVNPTPGVDNFTLAMNSPAFSIGFIAFDPTKAGRLPTATLRAPVNLPAFPLLTTPINNF